jgi:hypothetical protein
MVATWPVIAGQFGGGRAPALVGNARSAWEVAL